jgi:uncharacterized protein (DUF2237 family)
MTMNTCRALLYLCIFITLFNTLNSTGGEENPKNVLGSNLKKCKEGTGFYRNGFCNTGADDHGTHVVCSVVTDEFLTYSKSKGNDLITPTSYFPGLKSGDHWCLCGFRFEQARLAGFAPKVVLEATHNRALQFTSMDELKRYSI